jgi:hypothetical protein
MALYQPFPIQGPAKYTQIGILVRKYIIIWQPWQVKIVETVKTATILQIREENTRHSISGKQ